MNMLVFVMNNVHHAVKSSMPKLSSIIVVFLPSEAFPE